MIFTAYQCREKAADKLAQAARNIGQRRAALLNDAEAWLVLASKVDDGVAAIDDRKPAAAGRISELH